MSSHSGELQVNPSLHSLDWSIPLINSEQRSGSMEFSVGGDDAGAFFPLKVTFVGQGSIVGVRVKSVSRVDNEEDVVFSEDATVATDDYLVV